MKKQAKTLMKIGAQSVTRKSVSLVEPEIAGCLRGNLKAREVRTERSVRWLARASGVSLATTFRALDKAKNLRIATLEQLAHALGCRLEITLVPLEPQK